MLGVQDECILVDKVDIDMFEFLEVRPQHKAADEKEDEHDQKRHGQGEKDILQKVDRLSGNLAVSAQDNERHGFVGHDAAADDAGQRDADDEKRGIFFIRREAEALDHDIDHVPKNDQRSKNIDEGSADKGSHQKNEGEQPRAVVEKFEADHFVGDIVHQTHFVDDFGEDEEEEHEDHGLAAEACGQELAQTVIEAAEGQCSDDHETGPKQAAGRPAVERGGKDAQ